MKQLLKIVVVTLFLIVASSTDAGVKDAEEESEDLRETSLIQFITAITGQSPGDELNFKRFVRSDEEKKDEVKKTKEEEEEEKKEESTQSTWVSQLLLSTAMGTVFSASNAVGQTLDNIMGQGSWIGGLGKTISRVAERYAGKIKYMLFNSKHPVTPYELTKKSFAESPFVKGQPLLVIIHGFTPAGYFEKNYYNLVSSIKIKNAAIKNKLPHNIIIVDWTGLSSDGAYIFSSSSTATVADRLSGLLVWLVKKGHVSSPKEIRITGHSLGGHTAGITGKKFNEKFGSKIARIDAIDPAGPNFDQSSSKFQLTQYDADYVHVIHCNIRFLGSYYNRGNSDFYPNGGDDLPGCVEIANATSNATTNEESKATEEKKYDKNNKLSKRDKRFLEYLSFSKNLEYLKKNAEGSVCNHLLCIDLYIEVMKDIKLGCKCESWQKFNNNSCDCDAQKDKPRMGFHCPTTANGIYYLNLTMTTKIKGLENTTEYNNYGAGGVQKEELKSIPKDVLTNALDFFKGAIKGGLKTLDANHADATTPAPSATTEKEPEHIHLETDDEEKAPSTTKP